MMHASDRNRLAKRYQMLLFASSDMWHAQAAANAWAERDETDPVFRVLQTGMIVIYARPFSNSNFVRLEPDDYRPNESGLAHLHEADFGAGRRIIIRRWPHWGRLPVLT